MAIAADVATGKLSPAEVDWSAVETRLQTAGMPDPDLIIRTSGEFRLSNFLLLQSAYAEIVFASVFWPDFDKAQFQLALAEYAKRERRFGQTREQILAAARSRSIEVGSKWHAQDGNQLDISLFRADTDDELAVASNIGGRSTYRNIGRTRRQGLELQYRQPLAEHLELRPREHLLGWIADAGLEVAGRMDVKPVHAKAQDTTDPLHAARSAEVTSLWRLVVAG